jgi:hypothetical protein
MSKERLSDTNVRLLYHQYINKLEREDNFRIGFGLFLGGLALAALALLIVVASFLAFEPRSDPFFRWVQGGYALAMLSLPFALLGIVVLLPPPKRLFLGLSAGGLVVTLVGAIAFLWAYPDNWNFYGDNYTLPIVLLYAVGLGAISVGAGTSLREHAPELVQTVTEIVQHDADDQDEQDTSGQASHVSLGRDDDADSGIVTLELNGTSYSFADGETFGRREAPWLDDLKMACDGHEEIPYVSSDHVEFTAEDGEVYVEDLSRNGTKLNGRELDGQRATLSDGDTLVLADRAKIGIEL